MTFTFPTLPDSLLVFLAWLLPALLLFLWLRPVLTPAKALSLFETGGVLSARQLLAWVLAIYGLSMRAAGRLDDAGLENILQWVAALFAVGGLVKAAAVVGPTTITAKKIEPDVTAGSVDIQPSKTE